MSKKIKCVVASLLTFLAAFYILFVNYLEPTEVGVARNWINGHLYLQTPGLHITPPWIWVNRIDTAPIKVSVSTSSRGYNAKLVQFNTNYWKEFTLTEGWAYYWWYNRFSFNSGYSKDEEFRGFRDVMRGYAYSYKQYPFVTVLKEYEE